MQPGPKPPVASRPRLRVVSSPPATTLQAERAAQSPADELQGPLQLDEAYRRFAPYVAAVAVRILGRDEELDDVVQDVFLDATRGIDGLREVAAIKGWLAKITVRVAVRRLRRRALRRALYLPVEPASYDTLVAPDASPEQRALVARVYRALDAMPAADRVAWVLRHVQGESLEQGALLCGCSLSTYQRRVRRAAARLDKELCGD